VAKVFQRLSQKVMSEASARKFQMRVQEALAALLPALRLIKPLDDSLTAASTPEFTDEPPVIMPRKVSTQRASSAEESRYEGKMHNPPPPPNLPPNHRGRSVIAPTPRSGLTSGANREAKPDLELPTLNGMQLANAGSKSSMARQTSVPRSSQQAKRPSFALSLGMQAKEEREPMRMSGLMGANFTGPNSARERRASVGAVPSGAVPSAVNEARPLSKDPATRPPAPAKARGSFKGGPGFGRPSATWVDNSPQAPVLSMGVGSQCFKPPDNLGGQTPRALNAQ